MTRVNPKPQDFCAQARQLACLAQEARLLEFGLEAGVVTGDEAACRFEAALGQVMDADAENEHAAAEAALAQALAGINQAGLSLTTGLSDMKVDGILGGQTLRVLTAVLAPVRR